MRVLFVCGFPCAVNSGSHQRLFHLLKGIAAVGEVTLVYPTRQKSSGADLDALRPFCRRIRTFPFESVAYQRDSVLPRPVYWAKHKLRYLHPVTPALIQQLGSTEARTLIADLCAERFDVVWSQRVSSLSMLPSQLTSRVIVDLDDLEHRSLRSRLLLRKDPWYMVPLQWIEYLKLRNVECSLSRFPYEFVVCSERDREVVGKKAAKVRVIPNGIDLPAESNRICEESSAPLIVFVGYMAYEPNADAALFFARRVLPLIQQEAPDVKFLIVGKDPASSVLELHDGRSIFVTGTVPDVTKYLLEASVVVAPIRFGGGTRIKILEAFAHGKAVVSTTPGAEGIEVQSGKHLLLADSPEEFAESCALLLKNRDLRSQLGEQGRALVRERYQWTKIESMIADLVSGRVPARVPEEGSLCSDAGLRPLSPTNPAREEGDGKRDAQSGRILGTAPENTQLM